MFIMSTVFLFSFEISFFLIFEFFMSCDTTCGIVMSKCCDVKVSVRSVLLVGSPSDAKMLYPKSQNRGCSRFCVPNPRIELYTSWSFIECHMFVSQIPETSCISQECSSINHLFGPCRALCSMNSPNFNR